MMASTHAVCSGSPDPAKARTMAWRSPPEQRCMTSYSAVAVASSSAYGQDLTQPVGATRGQDAAQGYNLVHVYAETIVHSAVSLQWGADVGEPVPAEEAGRRIAGRGIGWREAE